MKRKIKLKDIEDFENIRDNLGERFKDWRFSLYMIYCWLGLLTIVIVWMVLI